MHLERPLVFFDLETTGIDVEQDHVIEIACLKVFPDRQKQKFETLVNPGRFLTPEISELTGITDEHLVKAPRFAEIADELSNILANSDLAGYNAVKFDLPVLRNEFGRIDKPFPCPPDVVVLDAFEILRHHEQRNLAWTFKYYLGTEMPDAHRAMGDVAATEDIMREQILRYELRGTPAEIVSKLRYPFLDSGRRLKVDGEHVIVCFGKHRGKTLRELTESDPGYVVWMTENLDTEVVEILRRYVHFESPEVPSYPEAAEPGS
ncbi:MAG: 3'-5' exonuclease [Rhodothermales bacterium]|nr:3'-5' exonuclease [Rhodothermales bacterium]